MSLKAIKEVMLHAKRGYDTPPELDRRAEAELAALEEAAKNLVEIWGYAGDGNPAETLIRAIAKEAES